MKRSLSKLSASPIPSVIRRLLVAWLLSVTTEYLLLPATMKDLQMLEGISKMSAARVLILTVCVFVVLTIVNSAKWERWLMVSAFAVLSLISLCYSFTVPFLIVCLLILSFLVYYTLKGWDQTSITVVPTNRKGSKWWIIVCVAAILFFLFVSIWTVCRVLSFSTPTYDFGIFSQMFYHMKESGLPLTTVERDGLLSHFHVHVSPIYYLLLPFYCLFPFPATLQVLQAAVLASAVIPMWLICRQHKLHPAISTGVCLMLLLYPAFSGGTSYDVHENAFLAPLVLWLFYGFDRKNLWVTLLSGVLILAVKEDAAVYAAVISLYYLVHGLLHKEYWKTFMGLLLLALSVIWFVAVTGYLAQVGDGVMTYRYKNFMYDGSGSLITVIKSVLICPMKAVFECVDKEKLQFIAYTLLPLAALPFLTRRYERLVLLIPYILVNLMSDYQYQHSIFFQYTYGSVPCLFYLTAVNLADMKIEFKRITAVTAAVSISAVTFACVVVLKAISYPKRFLQYSDSYTQIQQTLSLIPDDATVSATTFYTTYLSQRSVLYDVKYAAEEHILSTEYVVLNNKDDLFNSMCVLLESNSYEIYAELENTLTIYRKDQ